MFWPEQTDRLPKIPKPGEFLPYEAIVGQTQGQPKNALSLGQSSVEA